MKSQKLSTNGFILEEAAVGVVLFSLILVLVVHGVGFIAQQVAVVTQRHHLVCAAMLQLHDQVSGFEAAGVEPAYSHSSIEWRKVQATQGDQTVTFYGACQRP